MIRKAFIILPIVFYYIGLFLVSIDSELYLKDVNSGFVKLTYEYVTKINDNIFCVAFFGYGISVSLILLAVKYCKK